MHMKHSSHFDLKLGIQGTDSGNNDPLSLDILSSLVTISADNGNASWPDPLSIPTSTISINDIPDENTAQNQTMFSTGSGDDLYENSEEATRDNDNVSDPSSTDSEEYLDIDAKDLPQALIYEDDVLEDYRGGHTYQNHLREECLAMLI